MRGTPQLLRFARAMIIIDAHFFGSQNGMSPWLRCLLHRPFDQLCNTRHAERQAGGSALPASDGGKFLRIVWSVDTTCGVHCVQC